MTDIKLTRTSKWPRKTLLGKLHWPEGECFTLEDPLIFNPHTEPSFTQGASGHVYSKIPGLTAIPSGTYRVVYRYSNRFSRFMPAVQDVPGFKNILIHSGNTVTDTEGCIILGEKVDIKSNALLYSKLSVRRFNIWFGKANKEGPVWLTVSNPL